MTEFLHQPKSEFVLAFDLLEVTVLDPNKEFVVLEQPQTIEAQQQSDEPIAPGAAGPTFIVIERDIHPVIPGEPVPPTQYRQWVTGKGAEAAIPKPLDESTHELWRRSGASMEQGGPSANTWLLTTFFEKAQTPEDLAHILNFGFRQSAHLVQRHRQTLGSALQPGVVKSLRFAEKEGAHVMPEAVGRAFNALEPTDLKWARIALQRLLASALTAKQLTSQVRREMQTAGNTLIIQGIKMYEEAGLLDDSFWVQAGIKEVGNVADLPEFLTEVHARLTGPDGERILGRISDRRTAGRSYIGAILEYYAQDPLRHRDNAQRVLERTRSLLAADDHKVDLLSLIDEANRVANIHNSRVAARRGIQHEKYSILSNGAFNYADAFLRVASIMRDPGQHPQVRAGQLEEDAMHADIIALLFTKQKRPDQFAQANLSLRFPEVHPRRLRIAYEMATRGTAFQMAIRQAIEGEPPQTEGRS